MSRIRVNAAVRAVTNMALAALTSHSGFDGLPSVLAEVQQSVGADTAGFYIHEWRGFTTPVAITPDDVWQVLPFGRMPTSQAIAVHPGIRHLVVDHPGDSYSVTDLVSERAWHDSELVRVMRPDWGRNYQFAIPVSPHVVPGESQVWVLGRTTTNFTAADREVGDALAPVLSAVAAHRAALMKLEVRASAGELLTQREIVILRMQADGVGSRGIAVRLGISPRTAQKHAEHIYRKLGVHNRHDAIEACETLGVVRV